MIHRLVVAVSSSMSTAVPGPHVSCSMGVFGLHPWGFLRPGWINPSATLLASDLSWRMEQRPPLGWGEGAMPAVGRMLGGCWILDGVWGQTVSLLSLSLHRFLSSC